MHKDHHAHAWTRRLAFGATLAFAMLAGGCGLNAHDRLVYSGERYGFEDGAGGLNAITRWPPGSQLTTQPAAEADGTPDATAEATADAAREPAPEAAADAAPDTTGETTANATGKGESVSDAMPAPGPEASAPESTPESKPEVPAPAAIENQDAE